MTDKRKVQLEVEVDATKAKAGFQEVKTAGDNLASGLKRVGQEASKGLDGVGSGASGAAGELDKATRNIISSIQRTTAVMEAGERGTSKYFTAIAQQRGADTAALQPYLAQLDQAVAKSKTAAQALNAADAPLQQIGMSAKATAAAMRGVPAQFTDIITSLQGGQKPMTVLLQQGGQLKDMFGGIGPAARALGGYVAGLINPFTLAAAAAGGLAFAYAQGSKEADAYAKAIIMTGNAAGASVNQLQAMAVRVDAIAGTQAAAADALAQMAGTGQVASANLEKFSAVAIKMEREVGTAVSKTVEEFAELGKSPVEASLKLNEKYRYLTAAVYDQIRALRDQGKETEAASLAQNTYANAMETRTAQLNGRLGTIERAWRSIKDASKEAWDAMLNIGRADTVGEQLSKEQADLQARLQRGPLNDNTAASWEKGNEALRQRIAFLSESVRLDNRGAAAAAERAAADAAGVRFSNLLYEGRSKQQKAEAEIAKARADGLAAGRSELEIQKAIAIIRDKYKDTSTGSKNDSSELANLRARIIAEAAYTEQLKARGKEADKLNEGEKLALQYTEQLKGKLDAKTRAQKESALAAATELAAVLKGQDATKDRIKLEADLKAEQDKTLEAAYKSADAIASQARAQEEANATFDLGKAALAALVLEQQKKSLADLEATDNVIPGYINALKLQIEAQERYVKALQAGDALTAGKKAGEEAAKAAKAVEKEWQKAADQINQALADALMDGFSSGKGFAQSFVDSVKAMFNTMVLRPVISAIVSPVAGAATSLLGFSGAANAGGSVGSLASSLGSLGTVGQTAAGWLGLGGATSAGIASNIGIATSLGMSQGAATAAATAAAQAAGSGMMSGVMSGLMTAAPYLAAVAAVYMIAKSLDKSGTPHTGGGSQYSAAGGLLDARSSTFASGFTGIKYSDSGTEFTSGIVKSVVGILDSTATAFGKQAGYTAAASFADDTSKDGAWGSLRIADAVGNALTDWQASASFRTFSDGTAGNNEYLSAVSTDVRAALDSLDLPGWASNMLAALGDSPGLDQLAATVSQINATQVALAGIGKTLAGFANLSDATVQALIAASGGIERLAANASTYYANFYTEAERQANTLAQVGAELAKFGIALPATRDEFRALVESQQALGAAGAESVAALLGVSGAFASAVPVIEATAAATTDLLEAEKALADERAGLMDQLWAATNRTADIRAKELAGLDPSNRPIQQALYDISDAQDAFGRLQSSVQAEKDRLTAAYEAQKAALQQQSVADLSYLKTAADAQKDAIKAELDAKRQGYADQISAAQDARSAISGIASALSSAVKSVKVESDAYDQARLRSARSLIAGAASSGNIQAAGLEDALGIAGQDSQRFYSTFAAYAIDQAKTAGNIASLSDAAQGQLSGFDATIASLKASDDLAKTLSDAQIAAIEAQYQSDASAAQTLAALTADGNAAQLAALDAQYQQSISALDKTVADAQAQLDALMGIDNSVKSVADAMAGYTAAIAAAVASVAGVAATEAAQVTASVIGAAQASSLAAVLGPGSTETAHDLGIMGFAVGTNYVPRDMIAQIHEGEAIVPKAYNPAAGGADMAAELRGLRQEVAALQAQLAALHESSERGNADARRAADALQGQQSRPMLVEVVA